MRLTPPRRNVFFAASVTGIASIPFVVVGLPLVGWVLAFTAFSALACAAVFKKF